MVEQAGAEHGVEGSVLADVAHVVVGEAQVGELDAIGHPLAGAEVLLLALDPDHVVAGAGEMDRIAALQAAEVRDSCRGRADQLQRAQIGDRDWLVADQRLARKGLAPTRQPMLWAVKVGRR